MARVYNVGDTVLLRKLDLNSPPYIARLLAVFPERQQVTVNWIYRPEDTAPGRKAFHGAREVMLSDHSDTVDTESIVGPCSVLPLQAFLSLDQGPQLPGQVFFTRFTYSAGKQTFQPRTVPVFCRCESPYNPDLKMAHCTGPCGVWYHVRCLDAAALQIDGTCLCASCRAPGYIST
jgi:hypothetical protein